MATHRQRARRHSRRVAHQQQAERRRQQEAWQALTPDQQAALSGRKAEDRRGT